MTCEALRRMIIDGSDCMALTCPDLTKLLEMDSEGMCGWDTALAMCYSIPAIE
jgi:hypothetical protein